MRAAFTLGAGKHWLRDRPGLRILLYHGVVPPPVKRINARFVSTEQLDAHLGYISKHFQVISLDQAFAGDYDHGRMAVAVTYDDGYRNNLIHALPVLQKHRVPATIFVTTPRYFGEDILWADALDIASALSNEPVLIAEEYYHKNRKGEYVAANGERLKAHCKVRDIMFLRAMFKAFENANFKNDPQWADYWQLLDADEVKMLSLEDGISIGGHGTFHLNLDGLSLGAVMAEVLPCREWIQGAIRKPVNAFAFPDGAYSPNLVDTLTKMGHTQLLLTEYRFQDQADARVRDRFTIHPFLPTKVLMAEMLKGHYF